MTRGRGAAAWAAALAWCALIFVLSHQPDLHGPTWLDAVPFSDKIAHFLIYAVLSLLWARAFARAGSERMHAAAPWLAVGVAALYGISDEWHQSFVPGRQPDAADWAADVCGALCAAALLKGACKFQK